VLVVSVFFPGFPGHTIRHYQIEKALEVNRNLPANLVDLVQRPFVGVLRQAAPEGSAQVLEGKTRVPHHAPGDRRPAPQAGRPIELIAALQPQGPLEFATWVEGKFDISGARLVPVGLELLERAHGTHELSGQFKAVKTQYRIGAQTADACLVAIIFVAQQPFL
jgi:hypothetical protein